MTVLITTATGKVGQSAASDLIASGDKPRLYVRDIAKAKDLFPGAGYDVAQGDLYDKDAMRQAMTGIDGVFMAGLDSLAADLSYAENIINSAVDAGVKHIVMLSAFMADASSASPFVKMMGAIEDMIKASGLNYTILGGEWFMENFFGYVSGGELAMPFGHGKNSFVSTQDIGAVVAEVLRNPAAHTNKSYIMTGPETLDHDDVVAVISKVVGKPCVYKALTEEEFRQKTAAIGWEQWMTDLYVDITAFMRDGMVAGTSEDVRTILGRAPMSLEQFVTQYKAEFSALCDPA